MSLCNKLVTRVFLIILIILAARKYFDGNENEEELSEAGIWLQEQNLSQYKSLFKEHGMRWHEMAIDQAELESKIDSFRRDASKVEELFEQYVNFDKRAKVFAYGIWPFPWLYEKIKKIWTKVPLEEILKVLAFNEEIYNSIAVTRKKLDRNTEIESESDRIAEKSLRQSLIDCEMILSEIEGRFAKFDEVFKAMRKESSDSSSDGNTGRPKIFRRFLRCF